jgi:Na+-transporting NADH:ubiquinone oxidoreductase subunit E
MLENLLNIFVKSIFVDNMIFAYFLGMCSYLAVSKKYKTAAGLGLAVIFVLGITVPLNWLAYNYLLKEGALAWVSPQLAGIDLEVLKFIVFIAIVAAFVQLTEMAVEKLSPSLYNSLGIFLPLIAVNCSILGAALFLPTRDYTLVEATTFGLGSGLGWFLAVVALAAIREKMAYSDVPKPLRGLGITFIIVGLMAFGFMSFGGFELPFKRADDQKTEEVVSSDKEKTNEIVAENVNYTEEAK